MVGAEVEKPQDNKVIHFDISIF